MTSGTINEPTEFRIEDIKIVAKIIVLKSLTMSHITREKTETVNGHVQDRKWDFCIFSYPTGQRAGYSELSARKSTRCVAFSLKVIGLCTVRIFPTFLKTNVRVKNMDFI